MRLPRSFRRGHDGSLACKHRDLSCCAECAAKYPNNILDVRGVHYWYATRAGYDEMAALLRQPARAS